MAQLRSPETRASDLPDPWLATGEDLLLHRLPSPDDDPFWNHFWTAKLAHMGRVGIQTFSRPLKYRNQTVRLPDGGVTTVLVGNEKGIDVRLALDIVAAARDDGYDVALIFSQDQDLSEVADEVRAISVAAGPLDQDCLCLSRQPDV